MIEIEVKVNGENKIINVSNPKGKHRKQYLEAWSEAVENPEDSKIAISFLNSRNKLLLELTNGQLKEKDLDEMDLTDIDKLLKPVEDIITMRSSSDFLKK